MINNYESIDGTTLDEIWAQLFQLSQMPNADVMGATMLRIKNPIATDMFAEPSQIRLEIDNLLKRKGRPRVRETAGIIFPYSTWKSKNWNIDQLTTWYVGEFMPRLRAIAPPHLRNTYFERMVNYSGLPGATETDNQLKFLISACRDGNQQIRHFRQSGLQVSIFDPKRDHSRNPRKNFPCLQQLGFHFQADGSLGLSAYYPTQLIIERAYGNYLGLCQLGIFMADQLGITFTEFVCFVGSPRMGNDFRKGDLVELSRIAKETVDASHELPATIK